MIKFLFGGGLWTVWYVGLWVGTGLFVALPLAALIRDAIPRPAGPASLGTFGLCMSIGFFTAVTTIINIVMACRIGGMNWGLSILIGVAAGAAACFVTFLASAQLGEAGGYVWAGVSSAVCLAVMAGNLIALSAVRAAAA